METRNCQNCKENFIIEPDDFSFYEKIGVPPPLWCPHCRFIRRLAFMNFRSLYKRECGHCKKSTISMYHPDTNINVWCAKCYLSDVWDARDYAKEYDFSRTFFEQLLDLKSLVPHRALDQNEKNGAGCEYANYCYSSKNIYLSFDVGKSENLKYTTYALEHNKNCLDCLIVRHNDLAYECVQSSQNYACSFLIDSDQCVESHFLFDCINCVNCYMSTNLRNKSYVFRNQQVTREQYLKLIKDEKLNTFLGQKMAKGEFLGLVGNSIHKHANVKNSVNTVGDYIDNSKNLYQCYGVEGGENCKYIFISGNTPVDCYDLVATGKLELCYEASYAGRGGNRLVFSPSCGGGSKNLFYCFDCRGSSDCFGCVGLSKKQYCIFNTQYTKEEYEVLIEMIKKHMNEMSYKDSLGRIYPFGENFSADMSPFAYNETIAYEEKPLTKEEALKAGYKWRDLEEKFHTPTISSNDLPDSIEDANDGVCQEVIECPNKGKVENLCTSAFKILPDELAFYRQMDLPLPRYCPNCRYYDRLYWKNPFRFYKRECMCGQTNHSHQGKCVNSFETMYSPERQWIIYCKECYQKEIY